MHKRKMALMASLLALFVAAAGCSSSGSGSSGSGGSTSTPAPSSSSGSSSSAPAGSSSGSQDAEPQFKEVKLTLLVNWNGSSATYDKDYTNTRVAQIIKEKTGVTIEFIGSNQNEVEKINTIFATQDLPDIYTGPAWGPELDVLTKAAHEGQLYDFSGELHKYPNLAKLIQPENVPYSVYYNSIDAYDGKKYILYNNFPATGEDIRDWLYAMYVRKDIAEKVGDPSKVRTPEDLLDYLRRIKALNLKENGMPVIPLGGQATGQLYRMFYSAADDYVFYPDGSVRMEYMAPEFDQYVLFHRKLIEEELLDPERWVQSDAIYREKIAQGRYAVIYWHYYNLYDATRDFVNSRPEAEYILLGPTNDANGDPFRTVFKARGANATAITKKAKDPEAALRVLDFIASDEGYLLTHYGIEGIHYDMVDGKPLVREEWYGKDVREEGIGLYSSIEGLDRTMSLGGGAFGWQFSPQTEMVRQITKQLRQNGVEIAQGIDPSAIYRAHPKYEQVSAAQSNMSRAWKEAAFKKSDEEALQILKAAREELVRAGIEELQDAVAQAAKEMPMMKYLTGN